jgi:hypothetical protein
MTALTDFLNKQAEKQRAQGAQLEKKRTDWVQSVERLLGQLKTSVQQADTHRIVQIEPARLPRQEEDIGNYTVPGLVLTVGSRRVMVQPVARNVVGYLGEGFGPDVRAQGRVDITDGERKFMLYRIVDGQGEKWVMVDDEDFKGRRLDQTAFEAALLSLLE